MIPQRYDQLHTDCLPAFRGWNASRELFVLQQLGIVL